LKIPLPTIKAPVIDPVRGAVLSLDGDGDGVDIPGLYFDAIGFQAVRTADLITTEWTHIAATFDDTNKNINLYINGVKTTEEAARGSIVYNRGTDTTIGKNSEFQGLVDANGLVDDIRIYSSVLSAEEISILVNDRAEVSDDVLITVVPQDDAPLIDLDADNSTASGIDFRGTFVPGLGPVSIADTDTTVFDADNTVLTTVTIEITNRPDGQFESLSATVPDFNWTNTYDAASGELTLVAPTDATTDDWVSVIASVQYNNTLVNPDMTTRVLEVRADDGTLLNSPFALSEIEYAPNQSPVLTSPSIPAADVTENAGPASIGLNINVSDADSPALASATVAISSNYNALEDVLGFTDQLGITGAWNPATGILSLTGVASVTDYQTAIQTVTMENTSDNPDISPRVVSWTVNDSISNSNTLFRTVNIVGINDAPALSGIEATAVQFNEDGTPADITDTIMADDIDDNFIESAIVSISSNFNSNEDVLNFNNQNGITGTYNSTTGTISLTGSATLAQYQAAFRSITYENTSDNPSDLPRTVSFVLSDGDKDSNVLRPPLLSQTAFLLPMQMTPI